MPANVSITGDDALTLDMVGQYTYCPRRFHLMYVEGRWADNQYTIEGRHVHRRVDRVDHVLPEAGGGKKKEREEAEQGDEPVISRSVSLASSELGLTAKLDLVSTDGQEAAPVETKRGRVPSTPEHFVRRTRLIDLLDDLAAYPVVAVVAPAGAGKTALAADWVRRTERPTAWLTLDDADCDWIERGFSETLAAAGQSAGPVWSLGKTLLEGARAAASA